MKKILMFFAISLILNLFAVSKSNAQYTANITNTGNFLSVMKFRGGIMNDSLFKFPIKPGFHQIYTNIPDFGSAMIWSTDSALYYHDGIGYKKILTKTAADVNYYPLSSNPLGYLTSVNSGNISTALGYTPIPDTRTLTINGTSYDLTANRSWSVGDLLSSGSYSNPTWLSSLAYSKLTGAPTLLSSFTNDPGYITGINSGMINSALGYTAYNGSSNPLGFLTTFTEIDPLFNTKFAAKTTTDLTEGTNLYYTTARFNSALATKNTGNLTEGSNLYYTDSRARGSISLTTTGSGAATYNNSTGVLNIPTPASPSAWSFNNAPGRSIVTTAAAANGFQISSTRASDVSYSVEISTTVSLSGNSVGYVVLEICATNSSTAGDWIEISRVPSGQSGTLVIGLVLTQTGGGNISGSVPSGWYTRIRSVNTAGTPTFTMRSGQEVQK